MGEFHVQTRNEKGELRYFATLSEAFYRAEKDPSVWKISFGLPTGERVRLVKTVLGWVYEDIMTEALKELKKT